MNVEKRRGKMSQRPGERQRAYGADSVGVVLLDVGPDGRVQGAPPGLDGAVAVVGARVTGFFPQVVELEGDLVLGVENAAVA